MQINFKIYIAVCTEIRKNSGLTRVLNRSLLRTSFGLGLLALFSILVFNTSAFAATQPETTSTPFRFETSGNESCLQLSANLYFHVPKGTLSGLKMTVR